jgi:hypothetical protein
MGGPVFKRQRRTASSARGLTDDHRRARGDPTQAAGVAAETPPRTRWAGPASPCSISQRPQSATRRARSASSCTTRPDRGGSSSGSGRRELYHLPGMLGEIGRHGLGHAALAAPHLQGRQLPPCRFAPRLVTARKTHPAKPGEPSSAGSGEQSFKSARRAASRSRKARPSPRTVTPSSSASCSFAAAALTRLTMLSRPSGTAAVRNSDSWTPDEVDASASRSAHLPAPRSDQRRPAADVSSGGGARNRPIAPTRLPCCVTRHRRGKPPGRHQCVTTVRGEQSPARRAAWQESSWCRAQRLALILERLVDVAPSRGAILAVTAGPKLNTKAHPDRRHRG